MADWAFEPRRDKDGKLVSPSNDQLVHDGDWRVYVAAYRRFMDDETSAMWNKSAFGTTDCTYQLVSFRQGNIAARLCAYYSVATWISSAPKPIP